MTANRKFAALVALALLSLAACKKEENKKVKGPEDQVKTKLAGKWRLMQLVQDYNSNNVMDDSVYNWPDTEPYTVTFNTSGTADVFIKTSSGDLTETFTWVTNSAGNGFDITNSSDNIAFIINVDGHVLIDRLTATELVTKEEQLTPTVTRRWSVFKKE